MQKSRLLGFNIYFMISICLKTSLHLCEIHENNQPLLTTDPISCSSSTFSSEGEFITSPYTQGEWIGYFGKEMVSLPPLAAIETTMGFITQSENFFVMGANWQGIMGLAYAELARVRTHYIVTLFLREL